MSAGDEVWWDGMDSKIATQKTLALETVAYLHNTFFEVYLNLLYKLTQFSVIMQHPEV